jgi:diguanylate cyclase (GGDEF)-like protein
LRFNALTTGRQRMTDTTIPDRPRTGPESAPDTSVPRDLLRATLLDSRQRWRELVTLWADIAFETDIWGRFVFVVPDPVLGWAAGALLEQPAALLLAHGTDALFDPFRPTVVIRRRRAWIKRADGSVASLVFAVAPLTDSEGHITGARGIGVDMTEYEARSDQVAESLRRGEVLDHIVWRVGQEVLAPRMMSAALNALMNALGAEGTAVIVLPASGLGAELVHSAGLGADAVLQTATRLLGSQTSGPVQTSNLDGRPMLLVACQTRFGAQAGLAAWRPAEGRPWDSEERLLLGSAANIVRMVLEHEAIQREMARQARTDPLTGLLNRRAFLEEMERHVERLDREELPGTLMFADLDYFKPVNDKLGHETGDQVLVQTASLLRRAVRPSDLVARLGGDEFAVWMSGADHLTAAERADSLTQLVPAELGEIVGEEVPRLTMSIGIATRHPGSDEPIDSLIRRADLAMYEVKRTGRGHWRVSPTEGD